MGALVGMYVTFTVWCEDCKAGTTFPTEEAAEAWGASHDAENHADN